MTTTLAQRRLVRQCANVRSIREPVCVIPGAAAPHVAGESWHYETRGGRRIYHPGAYARRGWSNMVYVSSTLRLVVGADWLAAQESFPRLYSQDAA